MPHLLKLVFHTPMLCFRFRYPYLGIWFSESYVWISFCQDKSRFTFFWMSIILYKRLWNFFRKCQFFCQNLRYNVYSDISKGEVLTRVFVSIVPWLSLPPLIHGNSSSKTYLANRSFLFVPTKGTLLNGTPTKQYVFDSPLFFQHK